MKNSIDGLYIMNRYQTPINDELKKSLKKEIYEELIETIDSIKFIQHLVAPENIRGYAKDRPKDEDYDDGRINVDITHPHLLEDMDFFRERALFFQKNGKYTNLPADPNPMSEYGEFWKEEVRRWKEGLVRPSDGEWIPGQLYFYWNYAPIWLSKGTKSSSKSRKKKGARAKAFAKPWLGDYLYFHYMEQGRFRGQHGKLLKTRRSRFRTTKLNIITN